MKDAAICKLCLSTEKEFYCRKDSVDVFRCRRCGLIYSSLSPSDTDVRRHYSREYFKPYLEAASVHERKRFSKRIKEIKKIKGGGTLLDIGSGVGLFLKLAADRGYKTLGVDVSSWACEYARKNFNLTVFNGEFKDAGFKPESCDIITLWHILEHVRDPQPFLNDINRLLKNNGLLALEVPNIASRMAQIAGIHWELMAPREHLFYFTPQTLKRMLASAGFDVLKIKTYFWTTPHMILMSYSRSCTGYRRIIWKILAGACYPFSWFRFKTLLHFMRGDAMVVYSRKSRNK